MIRLAIDVMGGDHGIAPLVAGAVRALQENPELHLTLVGDACQLESCLLDNSYSGRIKIEEASEIVGMEDNPLEALRNKQSSSMAKALDLVVDDKVDGVVSAGNTGALVAFSVNKIGMAEGVSRPAICTQMPNPNGRTWLLDLGATLVATEDRLVELARLGSSQCRIYNRIKKPRVGLLNVGVEAGKGGEELQLASDRLAAESEFEYCGYVEGSSIFSESIDVVVCDGFSGNVAIKTAQGVAQLIVAKFSNLDGLGWLDRLRLWLAAPALKQIGRQLDPTLYNGAPLLGLRRLVVKSHGSANKRGFANAILLAAQTAEQEL